MPIETLSPQQSHAWKDRVLPAVEEVAEGVWAIPVPIPNNPLVFTYCYAIADGAGVASVLDDGERASVAVGRAGVRRTFAVTAYPGDQTVVEVETARGAATLTLVNRLPSADAAVAVPAVEVGAVVCFLIGHGMPGVLFNPRNGWW